MKAPMAFIAEHIVPDGAIPMACRAAASTRLTICLLNTFWGPPMPFAPNSPSATTPLEGHRDTLLNRRSR